MLESLEQEYKREEDWCGGADKLGPNSESDHVTPMISKHLEQKEAFLKVMAFVMLGFQFYPKKKVIIQMCTHSSLSQACTLARRNADVFLKYLHRNSVNMPGMLSHVKAPETQVKSKLTAQLRPASFLHPVYIETLAGYVHKVLRLHPLRLLLIAFNNSQ